MSLHVHFHVNQTHFYMKGFARRLFETQAHGNSKMAYYRVNNFPTCKMARSQAHAGGLRLSVAGSSDRLCMDRNLFSCQDNTAPPLEDQNDEMQALCQMRK